MSTRVHPDEDPMNVAHVVGLERTEDSAQSQGPRNATPNADKQARVDAALDKMRAIAAAEGMKMVRNADNTGWIFVASEASDGST